MSSFINLLKLHLIEHFKINKIFKKENIFKKIFFSLLIILVTLLLSFNFYIIYDSILKASEPSNILSNIIKSMLATSFIVLIISNITQAGSYLFKGKDFDFLSSLPVSTNKIIIVKLFSLLISNYLFLLISFIPAIIIILINNLALPIFYFNITLIFLVFPLLILSISILISYIFNYFIKSNKIKNIILFILFLTFTIGTFLFTFNDNMFMLLEVISNNANLIYYPINFAVNALAHYSFNNLIIFLVINIIPFLITIFILEKTYFIFNNKKVKKRRKNKTVNLKRSNHIITLTKYEFKKYFNNIQYVLNTIIGKILFVIFTILIVTNINQLEDDIINNFNEFIYLIIAALSIFALTMTSTTTATISLDKNELWLLKSSPINVKDIFISKILIDLTFNIISVLISVVFMVIFISKINLIMLLLLILFLIIISTHNAILGLILNLKLPKFDWDLEIRAIKQSLSVFLHMMFSFILLVISVISFFLLSTIIPNIIIIFSLIILIYLVILIIEYLILFKKGPNWYKSL